jgi:hypothetical protein
MKLSTLRGRPCAGPGPARFAAGSRSKSTRKTPGNRRDNAGKLEGKLAENDFGLNDFRDLGF